MSCAQLTEVQITFHLYVKNIISKELGLLNTTSSTSQQVND